MNIKSVLMTVATVLLFSCAVGTKRMNNLSLGMSKDQVQAAVGRNYVIRGAIVNRYNQSVEVWEYDVRKRRSLTESERYWLYMVDGKLVQWSRAGNWVEEAERINNTQFQIGQQ